MLLFTGQGSYVMQPGLCFSLIYRDKIKSHRLQTTPYRAPSESFCLLFIHTVVWMCLAWVFLSLVIRT